MDMKAYYARQVEWYTKEIGWHDSEIEWLTKMLNMSRKDDKRLVEHVWSSGVITEIEMRI